MAKILFIDDDPSVRISIKLMINSSGHTAQLAENASEGLKQFQEQAPDLVITDITMPGMNGIEVVRVLRNLAPNLPIIVTSGDPKHDLDALARKLHRLYVLEKPFDYSQFLRAVQAALDVN